jgi:hypothetical protein
VSLGADGQVQLMRPDGTVLSYLGGEGDGPGQLKSPGGLDFGGASAVGQSLVVADTGNHRFQVRTFYLLARMCPAW